MNNYTDFPDKPDKGFGFIYFLRSPSGKGYIGQTTVSISKRLYCHTKSKGCRFLYKAIKKYGLDNFFVGEVGCYPLSDLDDMEVRFIKEFETLCPDGYNLTTGGYGNHKCSAETRKRMSKPKSVETRKRMSETRRGKPMSTEARKHMSKPKSAETRKRMSEVSKGKPKSDEQKRNMAEGWRLRRLQKQNELSLFTNAEIDIPKS